MAEPAASPRDAGFFEHSREILAALADYFRARLHLAGIETKEAVVHWAILLALIAAALFVCVFGYLFLCIGLVFLLARLLAMHVEWVVLALALAHFAVAVLCVVIVKAKLPKPLFSATLDEFKKDSQWLSTSNKN